MAFDYEARLRFRRAFGVVVPAALLAVAVWCYQGFPTPPAVPEESSRAADAVAKELPSEPAQEGEATEQPPDVPEGQARLPDGPGTTEPGIFVRATPRADGALDVSEVVWLREPVDRTTLRARDVTWAGPVFAGSGLVASIDRMTADGAAVTLASAEVTASRLVEFSRPVERFEITYVLSGATVRSAPSTAGRAIAALAPLAGADSDMPVVVWTDGTAVLNIHCPLLLPEMQSCAAGDPAALRTLPGLRSPTALVVLQLDLQGGS